MFRSILVVILLLQQVEFSLPDLDGRTNIFKIHARSMSVEKDIR